MLYASKRIELIQGRRGQMETCASQLVTVTRTESAAAYARAALFARRAPNFVGR